MDDFTKRFIKNNHFKVKEDSYQNCFYEIIFGTDSHNSIIRCHKEHIPQLIDLLFTNMNEERRYKNEKI